MDERARRVSIPLYLGMGWLALTAFQPLLSSLGPDGMSLLVLGGVAYSAGLLFYAWRRIPYHHAAWHVFVLAGSAFHLFCVFGYLLPARG